MLCFSLSIVDGAGDEVRRELYYVEVEGDREPIVIGQAPYIDYRAPSEDELCRIACDGIVEGMSSSATGAEDRARDKAVGELVAADMDRAGVPSLPDKVYVATLVGTDLDPSSFKNPPFLSGKVNTLWGEMAYQLCLQRGDPAPYSIIRSADSKSVAPGTEKLVQLFDAIGPCVILIDEFVAYARNLYGADSRNLPAGTFGNVLSFMVIEIFIRENRAVAYTGHMRVGVAGDPVIVKKPFPVRNDVVGELA